MNAFSRAPAPILYDRYAEAPRPLPGRLLCPRCLSDRLYCVLCDTNGRGKVTRLDISCADCDYDAYFDRMAEGLTVSYGV
jgi:hypothetical protein